jgi:hypothetical protein
MDEGKEDGELIAFLAPSMGGKTHMKLWVCGHCGHEVLASERPQPIHWTDGHICYFYEKKEEE